MTSRIAATLLAVCTLGATGCFQLTQGNTIEDSRRFQHEPGISYRVTPVAHVDETLWGFYLFGMAMRSVSLEGIHDQYVTKPSHYVTNWQSVSGTLDVPYLDVLMTFPYARVIFDVVDVERLEE